jgi:hypothetical protein
MTAGASFATARQPASGKQHPLGDIRWFSSQQCHQYCGTVRSVFDGWYGCCSVQEDQEEYAETGEKVTIPKNKRPVTKHWNWVGLCIFLYYCAAAIYYFVIRATRTLNMGYLG